MCLHEHEKGFVGQIHEVNTVQTINYDKSYTAIVI